MKNILMNVEMTKAILDGRKVQTRRVCNIQKDSTFKYLGIDRTKGSSSNSKFGALFELPESHWIDEDSPSHQFVKAKFQIGETIWVREPARVRQSFDSTKRMNVEYISDNRNLVGLKIPSRFLDNNDSFVDTKWIKQCQGIPNGCIKEMARIFLKITNVRVERIRNICIKDMIREGYPNITIDEYEKNGTIEDQEKITAWFIKLWDKTALKGYKWSDNPYVFAYDFERVEL